MLKTERLKRILDSCSGRQTLITDPAAVFYLTGKLFHPGERFLGLLIRQNKAPVLFVNELFRFDENLGIQIRYYKDSDDLVSVLAGETDAARILGVDKTLPARFLLPMMDARLASGFVNGSYAVDYTRAVKDEEETALMREASRINDMAMGEFRKRIRAGVTEKEVASGMMDIYAGFGAEGYSFEPIVAFGKNTADPHHMPDDTVLKEGDAVLFDVGCRYRGYCSDMTRTFFYQREPSPEQKKIYELVRRANEAAEEYVRPGVRLCDIDAKARDIITAGGYGAYFTHRLGHFIGVEDHEYGDVSSAFTDEVQPGNIFSIEPGIYHPDLGCRIEDLILVKEDGHEVLNRYPHDIEIIG